MSEKQPQIATVVADLFEENCYIAWFEGQNECLIVDPGSNPERILSTMVENALTPVAILNTHGHADHIVGNETIKSEYPAAPLVIGRGDADKLTDSYKNLSAGVGLPVVSPPADQLLVEGDTFSAAGFDLLVRETPGHCAGHIVFIHQATKPNIVFGGDVLFAGSVGRSDFPDSNPADLEKSIREKLYTLPDDTIVLPGHGPATTIGQEKKSNAFVRA